MEVGIYVGSFDPIHRGHMGVIQHLITNKYVERLIIVPTGDYWEKHLNSALKDRISMIKDALTECNDIFDTSKVIVDEEHNYLQYTYQVLSAVQSENPGYKLNLIIGDDNLLDLKKWKNIDELMKHVGIIVMNRSKTFIDPKTLDLNGTFVFAKEYETPNISSTQIREGFYEEAPEVMMKLIYPSTYEYITDKGLYTN